MSPEGAHLKAKVLQALIAVHGQSQTMLWDLSVDRVYTISSMVPYATPQRGQERRLLTWVGLSGFTSPGYAKSGIYSHEYEPIVVPFRVYYTTLNGSVASKGL